MTTLDSHYRGDTFVYGFTLGGGWVGADFTGGIKFTLRASKVTSSVTTDDDAIDQASVADGEIVLSGANGTITFQADRTTSWPTGRLYWDLQGVIDGSPDSVYTIDAGQIAILHDVTRST